MGVYSVTGSKFELGAVIASKSTDYIAGDFTTALAAALEVKEPKTIGALADEWTTSEFTSVTDGRTRTLKLFKKGKAVELVCGYDPLDAGQIALRAASAVGSDYAFRVSFGDKPLTGASPKPSTRIFAGTVLSFEDDPSGEHHTIKFVIQPNSNILATNASPT
jgi:hypothetical protein